jgi:hypothetical protein
VKLTQDESPVEVIGELAPPQAFHILDSEEAFKVLSSRLYNDQTLAPIRELCCNAYDAHVAAGKKDVAFHLHLPTIWEPWFSVKDDGIGMEEGEYPSVENKWKGKGVLGLYCTYFATDKSRSNDYIGALGLGSKSPFCYKEGKNGFTVTSRYQGRRKVYSAYLNKGKPMIVRQSDEATEECNGLEVRFAVDRNDFGIFQNKAEHALEFFNPKPNVNIELDINKQEYEVKSERWALRQTGSSIYGLRAIQGMVQYQVGSLDQSLLSVNQKKVVSLPLDLFFPIGELSVSASRESLSNDEFTIKNILAALDYVISDFSVQFKTKLVNCKTEWEARILIFSMINIQGLGGIINEAYNKGEFDGIYTNFTLKHTPYYVNELDYTATTISKFHSNSRGDIAYKSKVFHLEKAEEREIANEAVLLRKKTADTYNRQIEVRKDILFVVNDVGFGIEKYVHYFLQNDRDHNIDIVYLITRAHKDFGIPKVISDSKKIIESVGNPPFKLVSELKAKYQESTRTISANTPYVKKELFFFDMSANVRRHQEGYEKVGWRDGWEVIQKDEIDYSSDRLYVEVDKGVPMTGGFHWAEDFKKFIRNSEQSGILGVGKNDTIYGLPKGSPLKKNAGWVELTDYVFTNLKKAMTPAKELELSLLIEPFRCDSNILEEVFKYIAKKKVLDPSSSMQKFVDALVAAKVNDKTSLDALYYIIGEAKNRKIYTPTHTVNFNTAWKGVLDEYPMLKLLTSYSSHSTARIHIIDYIKICDKLKDEKANQEVVKAAQSIVDNLEEEKKNEPITVN